MPPVNKDPSDGLFRTDDGPHQIDIIKATLVGAVPAERHLSALRGCFSDNAAYQAALRDGDRLVYAVQSGAADGGPGALQYGLGVIQPGRVGLEFYMTKGHQHTWRQAGEVYLALSGSGGIVLQAETGQARPEHKTDTVRPQDATGLADATDQARFVPLTAGQIIYLPGGTAHRTVNTGTEPFVYLGVYPADAGHDYDATAASNFALAVLAGADGPVATSRADYLAALSTSGNSAAADTLGELHD
ncbi:MAG: hypothetical protein LBJ62_08085 [Bifidobacteriaceae bacterium]|jgi:glucose-6-phosphate isomerase|nr:hypothetical protein [Bifidobacteriaceae bacterium]